MNLNLKKMFNMRLEMFNDIGPNQTSASLDKSISWKSRDGMGTSSMPSAQAQGILH